MLESMLAPSVRSAISQYTAIHLDALDADRLLPADWQNLEDIEKVSGHYKGYRGSQR
jgi:hypothetical protein